MSSRRVSVFGPAYLDRVLRIDQPIVATGEGPPIDQSVEGEWKFGEGDGIHIVDPVGFVLDIDPPPDWPGPCGEIRLEHPLRVGLTGRRTVRAVAWSDDLGGMGAGYAAALNGSLHSALGPDSDPTSRAIAELLSRYGVAHQPMRVPDRAADWTLLVTSGAFGDKLPIGFRGCHSALDAGELVRRASIPCDLRVVAALPNHLVAPLLRAPAAGTRFFAPALRNMADREVPVAHFDDCVHILSCNRVEWETLEGHEAVGAQVPIVAVTDGPRGIDLRYTAPAGEPARTHLPAFPRARPPRDTNRAGEAFASTLVATLLDCGWSAASRVIEPDLIRTAAERASIAAALVLDRLEFGFPSSAEIEDAYRIGCVD
jgi:sugar/nucleoside kinase (ribokinase family)